MTPRPSRRTARSAIVAAMLALAAVLPAALPAAARDPMRAAPADRSIDAIEPTALTSGQLTVVRVTGGLSSPLGVVNANDGSDRLFVVQQGGLVRVVKSRRLQSGAFIDARSRTDGGGERGLLGLAFHPDFTSNGFVFIYYTAASDGDIVVSRLTANAARTFASLSTEKVLLRINHPRSNHNGGALAFGPDDYLYIATGDGGGAGDPDENGQDRNVLLGKILRIKPGIGPGGSYTIPPDNPFVGVPNRREEIWAYGMRNPWRISFDRVSGDLYIGDVGQGRREEVDLEDVADAGGRNYGWDVMEGTLCYEPSSGCSTSGKTMPVAQYDHSLGCSITGGYVYRGTHKDLQGLYVYGDYCSGRLWTMNANGSGETLRRDTSLNISSFGESETGELYLTDLNGALYRVIAPEFSDIANSTFIDDIHWIYYNGITVGCGGSKFCPTSAVTREQMAIFLVRAFDHPPAPTGVDYFTDDEGRSSEASINALRYANITGGCTATHFCPTARVTRAQMAIFLDKELNLPSAPPGVDYFDDDDGLTGEGSINAMAQAGITGGCGTRQYCPTASITREQMAAFLHRALTYTP